jgi:hypothetical protein
VILKMRTGTRKAILFAILFGLVAYVVFDAMEERVSPGAAAPASKKSERSQEAAAAPGDAGAEARAGRFALPERPPLGEPRADLFGSHSWQPPPPKVIAAPPPKPVAPPVPYRFAGQLIQGERPEVLLAKGDSVIPVGKGDTLDGVYRVEAIDETQITLLYLPLKQKQTIPVFGVIPVTEAAAQAVATQPGPQAAIAAAQPSAGGAPPSVASAAAAAGSTKPARLLWQGPDQVKLGAPFSVALKITSEQPVRASPMQLKYDPSVLESVAVKPGRFFGEGDRNFSYRVNPDGSIFVGASNQGPEAAADAEFIVLTFKPLKMAPVAELSIASLSLQGSAGRMITFDPLVAFKTTITP